MTVDQHTKENTGSWWQQHEKCPKNALSRHCYTEDESAQEYTYFPDAFFAILQRAYPNVLKVRLL